MSTRRSTTPAEKSEVTVEYKATVTNIEGNNMHVRVYDGKANLIPDSVTAQEWRPADLRVLAEVAKKIEELNS